MDACFAALDVNTATEAGVNHSKGIGRARPGKLQQIIQNVFISGYKVTRRSHPMR